MKPKKKKLTDAEWAERRQQNKVQKQKKRRLNEMQQAQKDAGFVARQENRKARRNEALKRKMEAKARLAKEKALRAAKRAAALDIMKTPEAIAERLAAQ